MSSLWNWKRFTLFSIRKGLALENGKGHFFCHRKDLDNGFFCHRKDLDYFAAERRFILIDVVKGT